MSMPPPGFTPAGVPEEVAYRLSNGLPIGSAGPRPQVQAPPSPEEAARRVAALEQFGREKAAWEATCRKLLARLSLPEQIVTVMAAVAHRGRRRDSFTVYLSVVEGIAPAVWVRDEAGLADPPWDDEEIARWFASACKEPARKIRLQDRKTFLGWREQYTEGWGFLDGSTVVWDRGEYPHLLSCGVAADGRRLYPQGGTSSLGLERKYPDDRFNPLALAKMASMASLAPLPPRPRHP